MQCDACRREAVIYQPYSGKHLCPAHFLRDFEAKAKHTIRSNGWLHPGDHIAVALSGNAAGAALLVFLKDLTANRRDIRLSAITIDTGISSCPDLMQAQKTAAACGVEWFPCSFAERYGTTMDALVQRDGPQAARCACRVLRDDLLGEIARAHGVTRCAFATTVDDSAGKFFSDLLSGTVERTLFPPGMMGKTRIPGIRPFMDIPEPEVILYAGLRSGETISCNTLPPGPCAGSVSVDADVRAALDTYARRHPATKFALANLAGTLAGIAAARGPPLSCPACGEPAVGGECEACHIRRTVERGTES
ncbi:MAG: tRNA(Ile)-lysidine synthase [Methanoregula sp.]|uniref:tRNA(Ile)-lysidine synthase n=1 Tax=Methanoregula sp. TaxID=2052170 RepID=UPI003BAE29CD